MSIAVWPRKLNLQIGKPAHHHSLQQGFPPSHRSEKLLDKRVQPSSKKFKSLLAGKFVNPTNFESHYLACSLEEGFFTFFLLAPILIELAFKWGTKSLESNRTCSKMQISAVEFKADLGLSHWLSPKKRRELFWFDEICFIWLVKKFLPWHRNFTVNIFVLPSVNCVLLCRNRVGNNNDLRWRSNRFEIILKNLSSCGIHG